MTRIYQKQNYNKFNYLGQRIDFKFPIDTRLIINNAIWGLLEDNTIYFHYQKKTQVLTILNAELNTIFQTKKTVGSIWFKTNLNGKYFYFARFLSESEIEYIQAFF